MCRIRYKEKREQDRCKRQNRNKKKVADKRSGIKLCYRGVKLAIEDALGIRWWPDRYAKNAGPKLTKRGFTRLTVSNVRDAPAGSVCVFDPPARRSGGGGHIEIKGTDGNYYSDFNQGGESAQDWNYRLKGCYAPPSEK
jgi:hypothetical protein